MGAQAFTFEFNKKDQRDLIKAMKRVRNLPKKGKIILNAAAQATAPMLKQMRSNASGIGLTKEGSPDTPAKWTVPVFKMIKTSKKDRGEHSELTVGIISKQQAARAYWVEYGTHNGSRSISPRPFIRPAIDGGIDRASKRFTDALWRKLRLAWKR